MIRLSAIGIVLGFVMSGTLFAQPPAQPPSSYFTVIEGDIPILLTAPHGGTLSYPFPPRSCSGDQSCALDTNTRLIAPKASDDFFALTGKRPYVVIAQGHRRYIDLNRDKTGGTPNAAYEDPLAEPYYDYYHGTIQGFLGDIRAEFGRGLLLDIHGQSAEPGFILRGTKDSLTTSELLATVGPASLNGPNSIFGSLEALGYPVDPNVNTPFENQVENPSFNGGYTVQAYGSHQPNGIDAIQLEFGIDFRSGTNWQTTAADLATAMDNFYEAYLVSEPGDFDGDGDVDGKDFLVWQTGFGQFSGTASRADGDANGDGLVDGVDRIIWENAYGGNGNGAAVAAVPEPSTLILFLIGICSFRSMGTRTRGITSAALLAMAGVALSALPTFAAIETYTDLASWEVALSGTASLEDFEGAATDELFGIAYNSTTSPNGELGLSANANFDDNAAIDVAPYISSSADVNGLVVVNMRFLDQGQSTNSQETVNVYLPTGISAFAFEYNNYDGGGDGTFLSFAGTNGGTVTAFDSTADGFFGVVDTGVGAAISSFSFSGDPATGSGASAFNSFDDVRYGEAAAAEVASALAVPEPASAAIFGVMAIALVGLRRTDRTSIF